MRRRRADGWLMVLAPFLVGACSAGPAARPPAQVAALHLPADDRPPHATDATRRAAPRHRSDQATPAPSRREPHVAPRAAEAFVEETALDAPRFSRPLPNGLFNPMPGGFVGGYPADTGLDIAGLHMPVYAIAAGTLEYSEPGHTRWSNDDKAVRLRLDKPIAIEQRAADGQHARSRLITHVWYAHLSQLRFHQPLRSFRQHHVEGGELLGISGIANGSPHLHLGLLLNGITNQRWGSYLLDDACRLVLGGWRRGQRLPSDGCARCP